MWCGVVSPLPNHQAGGPPLVGCPQIIQYVCSYPPHLGVIVYVLTIRIFIDFGNKGKKNQQLTKLFVHLYNPGRKVSVQFWAAVLWQNSSGAHLFF